MKSFFITGGAGFIGSHVCEEIVKKFPKAKIFVLDKLTYAGNIKFIKNLISTKQIKFIKADLIDIKKYSKYLKKIDCAINVAAESHVDNSFTNSINFTKTNVLGTHTFIQGCINNNIKKIIHISTDEVYGDKIKGKSKETDKLNPTNPYSASKASSDLLVRSWHETYGIKAVITNCSNNYGPWQNPEKLIPKIIFNALQGNDIPIYGTGENIRDWLHVSDHVAALLSVGETNEIFSRYVIGGNQEMSNINLTKMICNYLDKVEPRSSSYFNQVKFTEDRLGHDLRYAIDASYISNNLGFKPAYKLSQGIEDTVDWYLKNKSWVEMKAKTKR